MYYRLSRQSRRKFYISRRVSHWIYSTVLIPSIRLLCNLGGTAMPVVISAGERCFMKNVTTAAGPFMYTTRFTREAKGRMEAENLIRWDESNSRNFICRFRRLALLATLIVTS